MSYCDRVIGAARIAAVLGVGLIINSTMLRPSVAQVAGLPQPMYSLEDENDVDMLSFGSYLQLTDLSIGATQNQLVHTIHSSGDGNWTGIAGTNQGPYAAEFPDSDQYWGGVQWLSQTPLTCSPNSPPYVRVSIANTSEIFQGCVTFVPVNPTGSILTINSDGTYSYTTRDGSTIVFYGLSTTAIPPALSPKEIDYPDGRVLTYGYANDGTGAPYLKSVTRSDGLQLKYTWTQMPSGFWLPTSVTAINNAYEYCSPTATTCSLTKTWPTVTYSWSAPASGVGAILTVTDSAGRVTRYTEDSQYRTTGIKLPSSASADNITYTYCDSNCPAFASVEAPLVSYPLYQNYVLQVVRDGQTWNYSGSPGSPTASQCGIANYGFTSPVGATQRATLYNCLADTSVNGVILQPFIQMTDTHGVLYVAGVYAQIQSATMPEGNQVLYFYDNRGNITQETQVPKSGSSLPRINTYANYDTSASNSPCAIPVKCNKPNWIKDALGNETDYTYDPTHGGVLTVTRPADSNGIRPQTRYTYAQRYAWVLNSSGAYVQSARPIWVVATESFCRKTAASPSGTGCTGANDEVVKTYEYGPDSGPNNLFVKGSAVTADGVTQRTCYSYDMRGNVTGNTLPAAGLTSCP